MQPYVIKQRVLRIGMGHVPIKLVLLCIIVLLQFVHFQMGFRLDNIH